MSVLDCILGRCTAFLQRALVLPQPTLLSVPGVYKPLFRNDDVSWDTPLHDFRSFCEIFWKHGFYQLHGVTLYGKTALPKLPPGEPQGPYHGNPDLCHLDNNAIRQLSEGFSFSERADLLAFLCDSPDEIALHGLYHTDYAKMSLDEQRREMVEGVELLRTLFPGKEIRYFIAPFNSYNSDTSQVCCELGLTLLARNGVHMEAELSHLRLYPGIWYRYHHHRFYSGSAFNYYNLSLSLLDRALGLGIEQ